MIEKEKDIEKLIQIKELINYFSKENLKDRINEAIHTQLLKLDEATIYNYFIEDDIYFDDKYIENRTIDIFKNFDLDKLIELNKKLKDDKKTNLEKIFSSKKNNLSYSQNFSKSRIVLVVIK